jgi:hypothetical protein
VLWDGASVLTPRHLVNDFDTQTESYSQSARASRSGFMKSARFVFVYLLVCFAAFVIIITSTAAEILQKYYFIEHHLLAAFST